MSVYQSESPDNLSKAFTSIWTNQTVKPDQVVLVQDGPLPSELASEIGAWRKTLGDCLAVIEFSENRGLGAALNAGLSACRNELVARMDTDDIAFAERFAIQSDYLSFHPEVDVVGSFVEEMDESGIPLGLRRMPVDHEAIRDHLWASPIVHPTVMMRRSRVLSAGNYDPACRRRQDYELWFRCAENGLRFYNLPQPLLYYRFGAGTHKKQSPRLAWEQAMIGYRGATRLKMPVYQRLACFIPFVRSLLPTGVQHVVYRVLKPFDPRQKV
mgnify:CR=1 FL=1